MEKEFIQEEEIISTEEFYSVEAIEENFDNDEMTAAEAGFMLGYLSA